MRSSAEGCRMLTIAGPQSRYCDGMSRRSWLRIGGLALGGLALPDILRAEAASGVRNPAKGIIMVLLPGGPTHLDTFDLKPDAPAEIRGEFRPIATNVPGIDICELMPRLAGMADKLTIIRSLVGFRDDHNTHWCSTGWESHPAMDSSPLVPGFPPGDWPSLGSVLSQAVRTARAGRAAVRRSDADRCRRAVHPAHAAGTARIPGRGPRRLRGAGRRSPQHHAQRRRACDRLADRRGLAGQLRRLSPAGRRGRTRRRASTSFSGRPSRCSPRRGWPRRSTSAAKSRRVRSRYGLDRDYPDEREGKTLLDQFLLARRVIEAGARCVTLAFSRWPFGRMLRGDYNWDWHKDLFPEARGALPLLDLGLSALIQDLDERGLLDDVAVVVWGEFGRTPKINANAGRDHWPKVASALVAGGGMRCGQVLGSTTRWGEEPLTRPVHFRDVFATLYQRLGIDVATTQFTDLAGRPQYLVGDHRPLPELL